MATTAARLKGLADRDKELATQQLTDLATLTAIQAALSSGDFPPAEATPPAKATPQPPELGSGYYAAKGAVAEGVMNARFAREREAEAKNDQKSPNILQEIASFFRNIAKKITDFFSSKSKSATKNSAMPEAAVPPAASSPADRVLEGARAEAAFCERVAQRRAKEARANRPNVIRRIFAYFYPIKQSTTAPEIPAANTVDRARP